MTNAPTELSVLTTGGVPSTRGVTRTINLAATMNAIALQAVMVRPERDSRGNPVPGRNVVTSITSMLTPTEARRIAKFLVDAADEVDR